MYDGRVPYCVDNRSLPGVDRLNLREYEEERLEMNQQTMNQQTGATGYFM